MPRRKIGEEKKEKMKQISVSLNDQTLNQLRKTAKLRQRSVSNVASDAIVAYLGGWLKLEEKK